MMIAQDQLSPARALTLGTLTVGTLDLLDAIVFFGFRGVAPIRIPQSIASGVLGKASFGGGATSALLGVVLHYFIAFSIVAVFLAASRGIPSLRKQPVVFGVLYGVAVYVFMNGVVLPLSAAGAPHFTTPVVINGLLIHILGVGLPSALFARAARSNDPAGTSVPVYS